MRLGEIGQDYETLKMEVVSYWVNRAEQLAVDRTVGQHSWTTHAEVDRTERSGRNMKCHN